MEEVVVERTIFSGIMVISSILPEYDGRFGLFSDFNDALIVMLSHLDFLGEGWGALVSEYVTEGEMFIYRYFAVDQEGTPEVISFKFTRITLEQARDGLVAAFESRDEYGNV